MNSTGSIEEAGPSACTTMRTATTIALMRRVESVHLETYS